MLCYINRFPAVGRVKATEQLTHRKLLTGIIEPIDPYWEEKHQPHLAPNSTDGREQGSRKVAESRLVGPGALARSRNELLPARLARLPEDC